MTCAAAGLALAVGALAACTGSDRAPTETSAVVPSTATSTTPTSTAPSTTATSAGPAFPAGLPDAAKTKDKAGAQAFAEHFAQQLNESWTRADPSLIPALCNLPTSRSCTGFVGVATELKAKKQHYDGAPLTVHAVRASVVSGGLQWVDVEGTQEKRNIVDASGRVVSTDLRKPLTLVLQLKWTAKGWNAYDVKTGS